MRLLRDFCACVSRDSLHSSIRPEIDDRFLRVSREHVSCTILFAAHICRNWLVYLP